MPRYTAESVDRLRDAIDMVDLVSTRTELRRSGVGAYMGRCPFHDERTASFSVDAGRGLYHCFGCGAGGDAIRFVREVESLDFVGALEWLANRYAVTLEPDAEDPHAAERRHRRERLLELLERAATFYVRYLWESGEAARGREHLAARGLDEATLREFRVGYAPSAWDRLLMIARREGFSNQELGDTGLVIRKDERIYDRFRARIMFPLCDARGRVLGFGARTLSSEGPKYVNSPEGPVFSKRRTVYGSDLARVPAAKAGEVVAAEGYTDVIALHQAGIRNAVGVMGTSLTEEQVAEIVRLAPRVLLALDADAAGEDAMIRAARVAAARKLELRVVRLPDGLDPADLVTQRGADAARGAVADTVSFVRFRVERDLDRGELSSAEGKDAVIAALKPVFAVLPASALREELVMLVAERTDLEPKLVASWLPLPDAASAAVTAPGRAAPPDTDPLPAAARRTSRSAEADPVAIAERSLLAQCIAAPAHAAQALEQVPAAAWSSDLVRRAVEHLTPRLERPAAELPAEDGDLGAFVAGLVVHAADLPDSAEAVEAQLLQWRIEARRRVLSRRTAARSGGVSALKTELAELEARRDQLFARQVEATRPGD